MTESVVDILGQPLAVGDTVAYAIRSGNSGALKVGKITAIKGGAVTVLAFAASDYNHPPFRPSQPRVSRMVKIQGVA